MRLFVVLILLALALGALMVLSVPPWPRQTDDPSAECVAARSVYAAYPTRRNFDDVFVSCYRP